MQQAGPISVQVNNGFYNPGVKKGQTYITTK